MVMRKRAADRAVAVKSAPPKRPRTNAAPASHDLDFPYSVHPGVIALERWIGALTSNTGRSLEQWLMHIRRDGPANERDCRVWLKETCDMSGSSALWLAAKAFNNREALAEATAEGYLVLAPQYIARMFSGSKSRLLPLYEELLKVSKKLGSDVQVCPCKAAVSLYRRRLFARIAPATPRRIELGLSLGEEPHTSRLGGSPTSGGERISHCVVLSQLEDLDLQVKRWLKQAYDRGR
jgi:hypothetical protein